MEIFDLPTRPNLQALHQAIRAVLPVAVAAWGESEGKLYVENVSADDRPAVKAIIDTHDPAILTPEQDAQVVEETRRQNARVKVNAADIAAAAARAQAGGVPDIETELASLIRLVGDLMVALGYTPVVEE